MNFKRLALALCVTAACAQPTFAAETAAAAASQKPAAVKAVAQLSVTEAPFGKLPSGESTTLFTLTNANGVVVKATNYGGVITSMITPDKSGNMADIVLGFDNIDGYLKNKSYYGALIGRYGNRIGKAQFAIDGKTYNLDKNDSANHLHGGSKGFWAVLWDAKSFKTANSVGITLTHTSPDGDQGYPGNLKATVVYELTNNNEFTITYGATTDKPTHVNMTQHPYFNMVGKGSILNQELYINGSKYTPVDSGLIPTGELAPVAGTPFDFTKAHTIGQMIGQTNEQLKNGGGYDHNWVLNKKTADEWGLDARFSDPVSGRTLEVYSDEPGIQFYSGNFLEGKVEGKGVKFEYRGAICLEPQHYPDTPNKPKFPSTLLKPGEEYKSKIGFKFVAK
ncbi:aldose 1-epimerase [Cellvibrio zantedeschiae]|uniref:Aldose 1-epimerase n=1 Tax=Cellvibrio zantedeschiae TaxID=1237077 RepID=A0ABQ3AU85_9GAMM|nr:aldose epimerase family protein [Cellvibrio zantedeschiae]GGY64671.1 aldose 1-epimerase [Cellvibrio zantedeschiae]